MKFRRLCHVNFVVLNALLSVSLTLFTCDKERGPSSEAVATLEGGEKLEFSVADLLRPRQGDSEEIDIYQAPLIVQEIANLPPTAGDDDGAATTPAGESVLDREIPVVYYAETSSPLDEHDHRQLSYVWLYSSVPGKGSPQMPEVQGLRLTKDRGGHPAVIEVFWSPDDQRVVYISRSLEMAAARQFRGPLPGRRYAIERSIEDQPKLVVAGVIEDGPEPMGPMVYLRAGGREVGTITCRCMPSQVEEIRETREYALEPLEKLLENRVEPLWDVGAAAVPSVFDGEAGLREALRLPEDF